MAIIIKVRNTTHALRFYRYDLSSVFGLLANHLFFSIFGFLLSFVCSGECSDHLFSMRFMQMLIFTSRLPALNITAKIMTMILGLICEPDIMHNQHINCVFICTFYFWVLNKKTLLLLFLFCVNVQTKPVHLWKHCFGIFVLHSSVCAGNNFIELKCLQKKNTLIIT